MADQNTAVDALEAAKTKQHEPRAEARKAATRRPPTKFRVMEEKRTSLNGQYLVLKVGDVLDGMHYGGEAIEKLRRDGTKLEPIVED